MELSNKILSDITVYMKYAKYLPKNNRRETWQELVTRNKNMHLKKYPDLADQIEKAYEFVYDKKVSGYTKNRSDFLCKQKIGPIFCLYKKIGPIFYIHKIGTEK